MLGYQAIPERWRAGLPAIADRKFAYTDYSFNGIVASTLARAAKVIEGAGGTVSATEVGVPIQRPRPPKLEQWDMGVPDRRVGVKDAAWQWKGDWTSPASRDPNRPDARVATSTGAEATLKFTGSAVTILGLMNQASGRADVFLDGERRVKSTLTSHGTRTTTRCGTPMVSPKVLTPSA